MLTPNPGSRIWLIFHPGSRCQKSTGSRIRILNTASTIVNESDCLYNVQGRDRWPRLHDFCLKAKQLTIFWQAFGLIQPRTLCNLRRATVHFPAVGGGSGTSFITTVVTTEISRGLRKKKLPTPSSSSSTGCERYCRPFFDTNINLHKTFKNNTRLMKL